MAFSFSGKLQTPRKELIKTIKKLGGFVTKSPNTLSSYCITNDISMSLKTTKRAKEVYRIVILTEKQFFNLINNM